MIDSDITIDTFFDGRITIKQYKNGYRYSLDAILVSHFADAKPNERILDLGTGSGIIPIILSYRNAGLKIFAVELQPELADLADRNVVLNHMQDHIVILNTDIAQVEHSTTSGPVDLVISNPPFRSVNSGRINPNAQKAIARHEIRVDLATLVRTASKMLDISGRLVMIYPVQRMAELFEVMRNYQIEPKWLKMIHGNVESDAKLVIVRGIKYGRPGLNVSPPVFVYQDANVYTSEVEEIFLP